MHSRNSQSISPPLTSAAAGRDIERDLVEFIQTRIEPVRTRGIEVDVDTRLFEAGLIDSIHILALIGFVEHRLGRRLEDHEIVMPHFRSVRSIIGAFFA